MHHAAILIRPITSSPEGNFERLLITTALAQMYKRTGREEFVKRMVPYGISAQKLTTTPNRWVVTLRPSLIRDYTAKGITPNPEDAWCWSQWRGYLENEDGGRVRKWFESGASRTLHLHTSGHASSSLLQEFAHKIEAAQLVPIHGTAWDEDAVKFRSIRRLADGESMCV